MSVIYLNLVIEQTPLMKATVHLLQGHSPWTNMDFSALLKGMMRIASTLSFFHFHQKMEILSSFHIGPLTHMSAE